MKKIMKSFLCCLLLTLLVASFSVNTFALPISDDVGDHYIYNYFGKAIEAPVAYRPADMINYQELNLSENFEPVDLFVQGEYLYILNRAGNSVIVLNQNYQKVKEITSIVPTAEEPIPELDNKIIDENGNTTVDPDMEKASKYQFNSPNGLYVDEDGIIYVADTNNRRVVACDINGNAKNIIRVTKVSVLGTNYIFKPLKLVVDTGGGLQVIAYAVNRGLMQIDEDGTFRQFAGAPKVSINAVEWFWRKLATEEQKKQLVTYVPTEYNNITVDERGFLYTTISTLDPDTLKGVISSKDNSGKTTPVLRLNSAGLDTLRRKGVYPPVCDLEFDGENSPQVADVAVHGNNIFTLLDGRTGRFFTYDNDGNLLYMGGGSGSQFGKLKTPTSIVAWNNQIIVSDTELKAIVVYQATEYAQLINEAVIAGSTGQYELSEEKWSEVLKYNSGLYIGYIGMGKAEMRIANVLYDDSRLEHYEKALTYFSSANEKDNYSTAFTELQRSQLQENFGLIFISIIVVVVGLFVLYFVVKYRKKKKGRGVN